MDRRRRAWAECKLAMAGLSGAALLLAGCGTPGAPQPPSLRLPEPVADLAAARAGDTVTLTWTNPEKTTDGVRMASFEAEMEAEVCRAEGAPNAAAEGAPVAAAGGAASAAAANCLPVKKLSVKPGSATTVADALPPELATGRVRALRYWVVLRNRRGSTAGASHVAVTAAGEAPRAVIGLTATATAAGVVLRWQADGSATPVRLHRHRMSEPVKKKSDASAQEEAADEDLMVDAPATSGLAGAIDREARFDEAYRYTAERVLSLPLAGVAPTTQSAQPSQAAKPRGKVRRSARKPGAGHAPVIADSEVTSPVSAAVMVETTDVFPPAVPANVVATYTGATHSVDLSWTPDTEPDLAGYRVYRCADGGTANAERWVRISPGEPVAFPAYSDATAQAGRVYRYAVSAVDEHGNESVRSQPVRVSTQP